MTRLAILPSVTLPWRERIARRHTPRPAHGKKGYREYRACLRWEFGFSCAFCLCHETDLMLAGVEGWGLTQVEHFSPRSVDTEARNDYSNCFYICGRCNRSHSKAPIRGARGRKLLNPCDSAWKDFFTATGHRLLPKNSADAAYTHSTYHLDDRFKVRLRALRREVIEDRQGFLERSNRFLGAIRSRLTAGSSTAEVELARELTHRRRAAARDLLKYRAIPGDRNVTCRCGDTSHHSLPGALDEQTFDLSDLLSR